jgi:DmsE family decaheme c-type cytochrome
MSIKQIIGMTLLALAGLAFHAAAPAQGGVTASAVAASAAANKAAPAASAAEVFQGQGTELTEKGADTCLSCHDEESDSPGFSTAAIFKTKHAQRGNAHAPFGKGGLQCEACHGPGWRHSMGKGKKTETINNFKASSVMPLQERNERCLGCHTDSARNAWHLGAHDRNQLACTDCHKLHTDRDPVRVKANQADVCFNCHKTQRAEFQKTSSHPVRFGQLVCSDCHNAHGTGSAAMVNKMTVNQTCFSCHADKRGPLLWEHEPVTEDCTLCHNAHGSVRAALLKKSPPLLCQQCHAQAGHPAVSYTAAGLPAAGGGNGNGGSATFMVGGGCTNCHTQVHGSNHPSGAKLLR